MIIRQIAKKKTENESENSSIDEFKLNQKIDELSDDEEYVKSQDLTNEKGKKFSEKLGEENIKSKNIPEFFLDKEKESEEEK